MISMIMIINLPFPHLLVPTITCKEPSLEGAKFFFLKKSVIDLE